MIWYFLIPQIILFKLLTFQVISENQRKTQNWLFLSSAIVQILLFSLGRQTCRQVKICFLRMPQIANFQVENEKAPYRGRGTPPSHTLPPLGRYAPSGLVASLPRKDCAPKCFGSLRHWSSVAGRVPDRIMLADLRMILVEEWNIIPQLLVTRLVNIMRRCQVVVVAFGSSTRY